MLVWVAAALATITALLDRYTVLRVSDIAFAADIDWQSAAIAILPALAGVSLLGGCARVTTFSVIERYIDDALIGTARRLLAADWRDAARHRPEIRLTEISALMRNDARAAAAVAPAFAILGLTAVWLVWNAPIIALGLGVALPAAFAIVKKLTPAMLATGTVLAQAELEFDRVTEHMLEAGASLQLRIAREPEFLAQTLYRPIDDATRAAVAYARSHARVTVAVAWLSFVLVLIFLGLLPASTTDESWARAIVVILATLYPARQVLAVWPAIQRLRGLPAQLQGIIQDNPQTEASIPTPPPIAPARWASIGLNRATVDPRETPGLSIAGIGPIDISLDAGTIVALIGPQAEDRATLLHLLCGLIPPDRGTALLDGRTIQSASLRGLCGAALDSATLAALDPPPADGPLAAALYARFDLIPGGDLASLTPTERTRVALVAIEIQDRPIRLYDERSADVGSLYREAFAETLREARARGRLCILATSDARTIAMADRTIRIVDGRIDTTEGASR